MKSWRGGEHLLDQLAVLVLDPLALHQGTPGLGNPVGECVADRLQLTEVEYPWRRSDGVDPVRDLGMAEGLAEERRQLRLETADLAAQLAPRPALVDPGRRTRRSPDVSAERASREIVGQADSKVEAAIHSASSTAICGTPLTWTAAMARRLVPRSTRVPLAGGAEEKGDRSLLVGDRQRATVQLAGDPGSDSPGAESRMQSRPLEPIGVEGAQRDAGLDDRDR